MTLTLRHQDVPDSHLARWDTRWKLAAVLLSVCGIAAIDHLAPAASALALGLLPSVNQPPTSTMKSEEPALL